jgi:hypothetical protein
VIAHCWIVDCGYVNCRYLPEARRLLGTVTRQFQRADLETVTRQFRVCWILRTPARFERRLPVRITLKIDCVALIVLYVGL